MNNFNVRTVHQRRAESSGMKTKRWKIPRTQIYPGGYVSEDPKIESLLNIADYSHARADKQAGLYQLGEDIFRANVKFLGTSELLREKATRVGVHSRLLQKPLPAQEKELKEVKALFPQHLHPHLLEFLVYNLHQNSLVASPEKVLLKDILLRDYNCGLRAQDPANQWTTEIKIAKNGNHFSVTNTQVVNRRLDLLTGEEIRDPKRAIEVSSTLFFSMEKSTGNLKVRREFCIKSPDTGHDKGIIKKFGNKIAEAIANQEKVKYKSKLLDEGHQYQVARDYYENCLVAYKEQLALPLMEKESHPVIKSGLDFLRAADAEVKQGDVNRADLTTIFEFQAYQLCHAMQGSVKPPQIPKSLNPFPSENGCIAAINSLAKGRKRRLAAKACAAVGTLLGVTAVLSVAVALSALCPPVGFVFIDIVATDMEVATTSAISTLCHVANTAIGAGLKAHAMRVRDVQSAPELTHVGIFKAAMNDDAVVKVTAPGPGGPDRHFN